MGLRRIASCSWSWSSARAAVVVVVGALTSFAPAEAKEAACPGGSADAPRAAAVHALLARTEDGMRLARAGRAPAALCFVAGEGGVATDHVVHLPREGATAAQAARLGHLWQHVLDDAPTFAPAAGEACAEWLTRSLAAEARGDAVEARVAAALGEPPPKLTRARSRDAAYASRCP